MGFACSRPESKWHRDRAAGPKELVHAAVSLTDVAPIRATCLEY